MTAEKHRCAGRVYIDSYSQPTRRCQRPATVEEAGKWWCRGHAPSLQAARRTVKDAEYEATRQRAISLRRRQAAESAACCGISTEALEAGAVAELVAAAEALATDVQRKLEHTDDCGDSWTECPLHDAHKEWSTSGLLSKVNAALAPFREVKE